MSLNHRPVGLVLFAHGSRDPAWRVPLDAIAQRVVERCPQPVALAFLEFMEPTLTEALQAMVERGCRSVRIVPLFWSAGHHLRSDLAAIVDTFRTQHPSVRIDVSAALGDAAPVRDAVADWALQALDDPAG